MGQEKNEMIIHWENPEELTPHPKNPKIHTDAQVEGLASSIETYNWTQPVVIDENKQILAGHARVLSALKHGREKVPTVRVKDSEEADKLGYLLFDNHITQKTGTEPTKKAKIVHELVEGGYEIASFGIKMETAPVVYAGQEESSSNMVKQIVIVFDSEDFEEVIRKFEAIREREPNLQDNTEVFERLITLYEESDV